MARIDGATTVLCLTGPESSGKTTLAQQLADRLNAPWVPEAARTYFQQRESVRADHHYDQSDVLAIARQQLAAETAALQNHSGGALVLDTDLSVIHVWFAERFGHGNAWLDEQWQALSPRCYLLLKPDLPWTPDPLRENPSDRERLFERYVELLDKSARPYGVVAGDGSDRLENALQIVDRWYRI